MFFKYPPEQSKKEREVEEEEEREGEKKKVNGKIILTAFWMLKLVVNKGSTERDSSLGKTMNCLDCEVVDF